MRKIKYVSLALTVVPLLFVGCVQEKVSRMIPSNSTDNQAQTIISKTETNRADNSVNAKDQSNQIISESELDKLVALVQQKLAEEPTQKPKASSQIASSKTSTVNILPLIPTDEIVFEETLSEDIIPDSAILTDADYDNSSDLDELTKLVSSELDTEIRGMEGIYSTPIVLNEDSVHKKLMIEVEAEYEQETTKENEIISTAIAFLDTEYIWAANGPTAFDCSGFTKYVYKEHGVTIPRYSGNQAKVGKHIAYKDLHVGDLVFFDTEKKYKKKVNHVGIYMGDNKFIHASSAKKKVVITSFEKKRFYKRRFLWGQRIIKDSSTFASL